MAKEIPISSVDGLQDALDALVAVQHRYADVPAMLADQGNQLDGQLMRVADATADPNVVTGAAYYDFEGPASGSINDYYLVSAPESASLTDGKGTTANGTAVDLGGGSDIEGTTTIALSKTGYDFLIEEPQDAALNKFRTKLRLADGYGAQLLRQNANVGNRRTFLMEAWFDSLQGNVVDMIAYNPEDAQVSGIRCRDNVPISSPPYFVGYPMLLKQ